MAELLDHVPGGEVVPLADGQTRQMELRFIDFAAARKQLGLTRDADLGFPAGDETNNSASPRPRGRF